MHNRISVQCRVRPLLEKVLVVVTVKMSPYRNVTDIGLRSPKVLIF